MMINTVMLWVVLAVLAAVAVGAVVLQIFLARRESRWPGLVLPGLLLIHSLLPALGLLFFNRASVNNAHVWIGTSGVLAMAGINCLLFNIPTAVLLAVYFAARRRMGRSSELERMRAQDLE